ncbi:hypothetical protein BCR42DRAFT_180853 [Absidia repens]|uniref:Uncharacterized protein n=1 Tax=Absidia repens TaxID=90262 RepID=A0A1X2HZ21_9FUNG|nr:hypothetical protein BCR42DRAFT_180853 [Absidia repens]
MHTNHNLLQCPLHNVATMTIDTISRTIIYASSDMVRLLEDDPTGTQWPTKEDQQLCFTTLVDSKSSQRQKRLLTCEHINSNDPTTTIIQCADISALEEFYYNNTLFSTLMMNSPSSTSSDHGSTIILRMNPYGVIQAAFAPTSALSFQTSMMIGKPLMRFIHNDDIPILCSGLRQVTRCQQDSDDDDDDDSDDDDSDGEFTMTSFDLRCDLHSIFDNNNNNNATPPPSTTTKKETFLATTNSLDDDVDDLHTFYHFTTIFTNTQDILCIMRPSSTTTTTTTAATSTNTAHDDVKSSLSLLSSRPSSISSASSLSTSSTTLPSLRSGSPSSTTTNSYPSSSKSSRGDPFSICSSLYQLVHLLRFSETKVKDIVNGLQQALWNAAEQGFMILAHYLAVVMVLALQYYRLARHPSFWLETSELALRCLVAETKTRPELDRVFSWLEWSGLPSSRRLFGMALDHGSEWFISASLRP